MRIHSVITDKCMPGRSKMDGMGLFAKKTINKGELIAIWGGVIYSKKDIQKMSKKYPNMVSHPFGVYKGYYMGPLKPNDPLDDAEKFNHSCDANAGVRGQIIVVAIRKIKRGEEICFNYETVEIDESCLGFECHCESKNCRKFIDGSAWKNLDFRKKYQGFFSIYIQDLIQKENTD
jgi:SET domain-containing protein